MAWDWQSALAGAGAGAGVGALGGSVIPGLGTGIGALGGGLIGFFGGGFGGGQNPYMPVGDPSDVQNVNPYTDPFMQMLSGQGQNTWNQLNRGMGSLTGMINSLDPLAAQNYFTNSGAGAMRDIAMQNFDPFASQQRADFLSNKAMETISGQLGDLGPGAARSGAGMAAMMEGALNPQTQMNVDLANMIGGQAGQLQGQNMNQLFNSYNQMANLGLNSQLGMNQMLAGMYGQQLAQMGGLSGNEFWQPQYLNNPNYFSIPGLINTGAQVAGMFI